MPVTTKNPHSTLWLRASWNRVPGTVASGDGYRGSSGPSTVTCRWSPTTQRQETSLMLSVAFGCLSWPPPSQFNTIHTLLLRERKRKSSVSLMGSWREEFLSIPPDMLGESWLWCVVFSPLNLHFAQLIGQQTRGWEGVTGILTGAERSWDCFLWPGLHVSSKCQKFSIHVRDPAPQEWEYICQGASRGFLKTAMEISLSEQKVNMGREHQLCYASPTLISLTAVGCRSEYLTFSVTQGFHTQLQGWVSSVISPGNRQPRSRICTVCVLKV